MNIIAATGLIIAGLIHIAPITGVLGPERLSGLYGIRIEDPALVLLMRHRAVLFGMLGVLLLVSAFLPGLRAVSVGGGLISILSFLAFAGAPGGQSKAIVRIIYADWIALAALVPATYAMFFGLGAS